MLNICINIICEFNILINIKTKYYIYLYIIHYITYIVNILIILIY